jgi:hypothetical protein
MGDSAASKPLPETTSDSAAHLAQVVPAAGAGVSTMNSVAVPYLGYSQLQDDPGDFQLCLVALSFTVILDYYTT